MPPDDNTLLALQSDQKSCMGESFRLNRINRRQLLGNCDPLK